MRFSSFQMPSAEKRMNLWPSWFMRRTMAFDLAKRNECDRFDRSRRWRVFTMSTEHGPLVSNFVNPPRADCSSSNISTFSSSREPNTSVLVSAWNLEVIWKLNDSTLHYRTQAHSSAPSRRKYKFILIFLSRRSAVHSHLVRSTPEIISNQQISN